MMTRHWPPSVRVLVGLAITVPLAVVAAVLIAAWSLVSSRMIANDAERRLATESSRVQEMVRARLGFAVRQSRLYLNRIGRGDLPIAGDMTAWEPMVFDRLSTGDEIAAVTFANEAGESVYMMKVDTRLRLGRGTGPGPGQTQEFTIDRLTGVKVDDPENRVYQYDAVNRPWYRAAVEAGTPVWADIYFWFGDVAGDHVTGMGYATPVFSGGPEKKLLGVMVIDITLKEISRFLDRVTQSRHENVFVIDSQGLLVAGSGVSSTDKQGRRVVAEALLPGIPASDGPFKYVLDGKPVLAQVEWFVVSEGLRWRIVTMISEEVLTQDARQLLKLMIAVGIGFIVVCVLASLWLSRWLSAPVYRLIGHIQQIGRGDLETHVQLAGVREFQLLSGELNSMSDKLRKHIAVERSMELARQVQQSLLPGKSPDCSLLDVHGRSVYCEATGGDYYDFILTPEGKRLTVAIGDVMGHGIAAALLMATARAALRMGAGKAANLGQLMSELNEVLVRDASHGRFMTMTLAQVDPDSGSVRWASAGHDPIIIYRPAKDEFHELDGGSVPLSILEDEKYEEYVYNDLQPGDILFFGTDGVWEAHGPDGDMFGKGRLKATLRDAARVHAPVTAKQAADALDAALLGFTKDVSFLDDVTYVIVVICPKCAEPKEVY